jgi:hypothetical protein
VRGPSAALLPAAEACIMGPIQWLSGLVERENGFQSLLDECGSLAVAAWRLARARGQTWAIPSAVPTRMEVRAAALEIAARVGQRSPVPFAATLASDCEAAGLLVL